MANLAQTVNIIQALILTEGTRFILTPTWHVFDMYQVHQDATRIPLTVEADSYEFGETKIPSLHASASRDDEGAVHLSVCNLDPNRGVRSALLFVYAGKHLLV